MYFYLFIMLFICNLVFAQPVPTCPPGTTKIDDQTIAVTSTAQIKLSDAQSQIIQLKNKVIYFQNQINDDQAIIINMNNQITDLQNQFNSVGIDPTPKP